MSVEISADTAVVMKVKGQYLAVSKTAKSISTFSNSFTRLCTPLAGRLTYH